MYRQLPCSCRSGTMPTKTPTSTSKAAPATSPGTLAFKPGRKRGRKSLIEWEDPSRQAHVLDWRQRAEGFGLDVEPREDHDEEHPFVKPEALLQDEEPEAFAEQPIGVDVIDVEEEEEADEPGAPGTSREDIDL